MNAQLRFALEKDPPTLTLRRTGIDPDKSGLAKHGVYPVPMHRDGRLTEEELDFIPSAQDRHPAKR